MRQILHVTSSPRGEESESSRLSQRIVERLLMKAPSATVVERDIGRHPLPPVDGPYAMSQQASADVSKDGSMVLSDMLIEELDHADVLVIATPMHNFTVPSSLKAWIDHVVRVRRTFDVSPEGKVALLRDRPVLVAVSSGGRFSGDRTRQPDFLTPYLRAVLGIIGLRDLTFFSVEGTVAGEEAAVAARSKAEHAVHQHLSSCP